jgi:Asp/Glu/hydantoin racemase
MATPRIALIHATPVAVEPIERALQRSWPEAKAGNLLDDSLSPDLAAAGRITEELTDRIVALARYARSTGADAILFTCSAFGSAIDRAAAIVPIPVLKPNEAMFEAAIAAGRRSLMIATFAPAKPSMEAEFHDEVRRLKSDARLTTILVEPAMQALRAGDGQTHDRLIADRARGETDYDAIMLAHFSTSRAADAVRAVTDRPVLTSPDAAVEKMKRLFA